MKSTLFKFKSIMSYAISLLLLIILSNLLYIIHFELSHINNIKETIEIITSENNKDTILHNYLIDKNIDIKVPNNINKYHYTKDISIININDDLTLSILDNEVYYRMVVNNTTYYVPIMSDIYFLSIISIILFIIYVFLIYRFMLKLILVERNSFLETISNHERESRRNILFNLAININHELNSLLVTLRSVLADIKYIVNENENVLKHKNDENNVCCYKYDECKIVLDDIGYMVELGDEAIDNIYDVIRPLGNYKKIEYSNGDKNIYMLAVSAISMVKYSERYVNLNNMVYIDPKLKLYSLDHSLGMHNGVLVTILINHIKNSLEANANNISIELKDITPKYLYVAITDDGDGIPPNVLNEIFNLNITTKGNISEYERGVGMYINKNMLNVKYDGDVYVEKSVVGEGTTIVVKIRYVKYEIKK